MHSRLDHRAVEDPRAHADQAIVGDGAAVEDRLVADRHARADVQRKARVANGRSAPSWMLLSSPMTIGVLSARMTAPNQTLARAPRRTSPMRSAEGAAQAPGAKLGRMVA